MSVEEARSLETPHGRRIASEGWFVLNLADAYAVRNEAKGGAEYSLEPREAPFADIGVNVKLLMPGDPSSLYHSEGVQEGFLVLAGACTLIVADEERALRQWDYFHCPPHTPHAIVGAGDGPCAVLALGRRPDIDLHYPASPVAARYGASVATDTADPDEAYADWPGEFLPVRLPWSTVAGARD